MERALETLIEELRKDGEEAFRSRYRAPVLLRRVAMQLEEDDDAGFHTEVRDRESVRRTIEISRRTIQMRTIAPPTTYSEAPPGEAIAVHFVRKRPGGAFQNRVGIGRSADVTIPLPAMSKYHAFITVPDDPGGIYTLTDAGSKNGTYVGSKRLDAGEALPLADGEELRFGPYPLTFRTADGLLELVKKKGAS